MSIEREGRCYKLSCDICLETDDEEFDDFEDAVAHKKAAGWKSQKCGEAWHDICPDCQKLK